MENKILDATKKDIIDLGETIAVTAATMRKVTTEGHPLDMGTGAVAGEERRV